MNLNPCCNLNQWNRARWGMDWRAFYQLAKTDNMTIVEIGIGPLEISALPWFTGDGFKLIGVDPNPDIANRARIAMPDAEIHEAAIWSESGQTLTLEMNGGSSGIEGQWKPTPGKGQTVQVQTKTYAEILGNRSPALLNIDCEGSEHYVLQSISENDLPLPRILGIELWSEYPQAEWCMDWILSRGYRPIFETGPTSETKIFKL